MKKLFLAVTALGLLSVTACKKETKVENATENATGQTAETAQSAEQMQNNVEQSASVASDVPTFSNPEVQKFAEDYAAYYKEVTEATKSGDAAKIQAL